MLLTSQHTAKQKLARQPLQYMVDIQLGTNAKSSQWAEFGCVIQLDKSPVNILSLAINVYEVSDSHKATFRFESPHRRKADFISPYSRTNTAT